MSAFENKGEAEPPVFDPTRLEILLGMEDDSDTVMIKDITEQFIEDITAVLASLDPAIAAGNFAQITSAAHTVKGSSATFGLYLVEKIARDLEIAAKNGTAEAIPALHESLRAAFNEGKAALEAYFAEK